VTESETELCDIVAVMYGWNTVGWNTVGWNTV